MANQDSTHSIALSAKRFFSGTLISRCTGLAREIAMAAIFGTHPVVAAFWMAFRFAHLLRRLFGEGALHAAFVPHFESLRRENSMASARFFYDLSMGTALLLLVLIFLAEGVLGGFLLFGAVSSGNKEVIRLTMLMLPSAVFISLYALNTSLLNCERTYFLPSVAPTALNLIWIVALFMVWHKPMAQAVEYLAMMIVCAFVFQWGVTAPKVFRYLSKQLGEKWSEKAFSGKEMLAILRPFALGMLGVAATQINSALDAVFARAADAQGPAYLWYAMRIQQLPLALFGIGLTGALLPPISRAIQNGEKEKYVQFINFAIKRTFFLLLPMTAALFALGLSGINLIYGHGRFTQQATYVTTYCLWAYGLSLVPTTLVLIFASAFYGQKKFKIPTFLSLVSVVINVFLNSLFVFVFKLGAVSIALATTLCACINAIFLAYFLRKQEGLDLSGVVLSIIKTLLASLPACAASLSIGHFIFHNWFAASNALPRELSSQFIAFLTQACVFSAVFLLAAYFLRIQEILSLLSSFRRPKHIID